MSLRSRLLGKWLPVRDSAFDLLVVSGASATGKSSFIARLLKDSALRRRFGAPSGKLDVIEAKRPGNGVAKGQPAILHYDILKGWRRPDHSYETDPAFILLNQAEKVSVIVLANTPETLRARMEARGRHEKYADTDFLSEWYTAWLDATAPYAASTGGHRFVLSDPGYPEIADRKALFALLKGARTS